MCDKIIQTNDRLNSLISFIVNDKTYEKEIQKELPYEIGQGHYMVSNMGRVMSLYKKDVKILKPQKSFDYLYITICGKKYRVHRLVAFMFCENKNNLPIVHHINGDKSDARASNLQWVDYSVNAIEWWKMRKAEDSENGSSKPEDSENK